MRLAALAGADAARLSALHARCFDRPWSEAEMRALTESAGVAALAAEDGAQAVGLILIRAVAGEAEILTLAVAPERRRQGLARALVEAGAGAAGAVGADVLWLEVAQDNAAALALYTAAGFEVAGRRPGYYARQGNPAVDAVVMRRVLNTGGA